jgi:hypothetical protein
VPDQPRLELFGVGKGFWGPPRPLPARKTKSALPRHFGGGGSLERTSLRFGTDRFPPYFTRSRLLELSNEFCTSASRVGPGHATLWRRNLNLRAYSGMPALIAASYKRFRFSASLNESKKRHFDIRKLGRKRINCLAVSAAASFFPRKDCVAAIQM